MLSAKTVNFNVGVLGHVDSGKTSLAKALSTIQSTACFDKNPQSQERGITLDLGFSSFCVDLPEHLKARLSSSPDNAADHQLQFTLVDCPGHASLIRTIIGGAQIIDLMLLVVDITKGVQTQTAECLVIGEITCHQMLVVFNKIDLVREDKRQDTIAKMTKKMLKTLEKTRFRDASVVAVSASPGGQATDQSRATGIQELVEKLCQLSYLPERTSTGPLLFSVDHCFSIRGQGTVMTGTIIQGSVQVNDNVEITSLKVTKKVKSIQMFKKPVEKAKQGDRVGLCVTQFDPKLLERGLVCTPGYVGLAFAALVSLCRINYFKGCPVSKAKFHITLLHHTLLAKCTFFKQHLTGGGGDQEFSKSDFNFGQEFEYVESLGEGGEGEQKGQEGFFGLLEFEHPVPVAPGCLWIGSKLDTDVQSHLCRLAFHGRVLSLLTEKTYPLTLLPKLKVFKWKSREGLVERLTPQGDLIVKGLFKKETDLSLFSGLRVVLCTGEAGVIEGSFGQSGKVKVRVLAGLEPETQALLASRKKGKEGTQKTGPQDGSSSIKVQLSFKKFVFDPKKVVAQD